MITKILNGLGLTPEESEIYQSLLENTSQSASNLAKSTSVKRTYVYYVCEQLVTKGLITQEKQGKTTIFKANSPDLLLSQAETQKQQAIQAQQALEGILPTLKNKFSQIETKPVVTYYEGVEGIKKAYLNSLEEKKEILAYVLIDENKDKALNSFWPKYYKTRIENNIYVKSISLDTKKGREYQSLDKNQLRETKLVKNKKFEILIEKNIIGNKIFFFSRDQNKMIATIIENEEIAKTEKAIFYQIWNNIT